MRYFDRGILTVADELAEAYAEVFTAPPWEHRDREETRAAFAKRLESDAHRPGFVPGAAVIVGRAWVVWGGGRSGAGARVEECRWVRVRAVSGWR
ncbi:hypothetical protein Saso_75620 [Streptomyces asoensis]|uniref:Acetyltransferase n=2 Tax=Streptomyces asoensis TaxID=249586 RepID=A0ABQ3SD93_9ACTN|nr:hypothetical protein GCM10010496_64850 [Streptomyces asoensis]GHI65912.1 hypothetical protein Saso_75620 [Streptomyces asoensis]